MILNFYTVKGLEDIASNELKELGVEVTEIKTKLISGIYNDNLLNLKSLKTIDDITLHIDSFEFLSDSPQESITLQAKEINLDECLSLIAQFRNLSKSFSITISKYKANVDRDLVKTELSKLFASKLKSKYTIKEHDNLDIRVHIEESSISFSIRLFKKPLHDRNYHKANYKGSLKPTIAAALYKIAIKKLNNNEAVLLVDNFCGSGTILCEAYLQGASVFGSDINKSAIKIAQDNLNSLNAKYQLKVQSAYSTNWDNKQFNLAISNPPWGEQLKITSITNLYKNMIAEYKRILANEAVLCFIVKRPDLLIKYIKEFFPYHTIETTQISFNGQQPYIVTAYK